jgi:hypothetical protein
MATPLNPSSTSDIGPLSASSALGEPGRAPASDAAAASAKKSRADSGEPAIEPGDEAVADEQPSELNGASATNGDAAPVTQERLPAAAEEGKEPTSAPATPPAKPATVLAEEAGREKAHKGKPFPPLDYSKEHDEVEEELLERMRARYGTTLVTDMEDAQLLLSYVTRNGLQEERKVGDDTIKKLIESREHMRKLEFDSEKEEADFRKSCGIIAKAAEPVTVASLRDSRAGEYRPSLLWLVAWSLDFRGIFQWFSRRPRRRSLAEIACLRYRRFAVLALLFLLAFQIHWTISSAILKKTDSLVAEINKAQPGHHAQYYLDQDAARANSQRAAQSQKTVAPPATATSPAPAPSVTASSPSPAPPVVVATTSPAPSAVSTASPRPNETTVDKPPLTLDELRSKMGELSASHTMLRKVMFFRDFKTPEDKSDAVTGQTPPKTAENIFTPTLLQIESAKIRTVAGQVVDVLQKWVLPLLYGALGAMVFVVRTLSVQARERLFRKEAVVSLVLRVFLGMISGLAIGWFWSNDPQGATNGGPLSVTTLSPFALAFVAGYGVELFFALLDKIVSTFTNK